MHSARPTTTERGYGTEHQRLRKRWAPKVATGTVRCWRCLANGKSEVEALIHPEDEWDLGHDDGDRSVTRGPEHLSCNRATASRRPRRKRPAEAHPGLLDA